MTTPRAKLSMPRSSSRSSSGRPSWVHRSPRSSQNQQHSAGKDSQFLTICSDRMQQDAYTTPTHKDAFGDSCSARNRNLQAPKKRDELYEEDSARKNKNRAYDPDNLSIREFRLDGSSDGDSSTDNSSTEGENSRQQALGEMRSQWGAFTDRIMSVQIGSPTEEFSLNPRML